MEFFTILTDIGHELLDDALVNGEPIELTHIAVGDGGGESYRPNSKQMSLINETWRGEIISKDRGNNNQTVIKTLIPTDIGGFTIREVGIYDSKDRLIFLGNVPNIEKIIHTSGAVLDLELRIYLKYDNADSITIVVADTEKERWIEEVKGLVYEPTRREIMLLFGFWWDEEGRLTDEPPEDDSDHFDDPFDPPIEPDEPPKEDDGNCGCDCDCCHHEHDGEHEDYEEATDDDIRDLFK